MLSPNEQTVLNTLLALREKEPKGVFFGYSAHVSWWVVRIYKGGWEGERDPDFNDTLNLEWVNGCYSFDEFYKRLTSFIESNY